MSDFNIDPDQNYKRISNGDVLTGQQFLNLLEVAKQHELVEIQAIILLDCMPTEDPATWPGTKYGVE